MAGLKWGVYGVPETYLVSGDGVILMRHAGPIDGEVLRDEFLPQVQTLKTGQ
jgi:cytochrome c biogenesis protein CcmG/thiol:disulfide interchange protein DsbE